MMGMPAFLSPMRYCYVIFQILIGKFTSVVGKK